MQVHFPASGICFQRLQRLHTIIMFIHPFFTNILLLRFILRFPSQHEKAKHALGRKQKLRGYSSRSLRLVCYNQVFCFCSLIKCISSDVNVSMTLDWVPLPCMSGVAGGKPSIPLPFARRVPGSCPISDGALPCFLAYRCASCSAGSELLHT